MYHINKCITKLLLFRYAKGIHHSEHNCHMLRPDPRLPLNDEMVLHDIGMEGDKQTGCILKCACGGTEN